MKNERNCERSSSDMGDILAGRPHLGMSTSVESYRLLQYSLRAELEDAVGKDRADDFFRASGRRVGRQLFARYFTHNITTMEDVFSRMQGLFHELGLGVVRIEDFQPETQCIILTIGEDLDCSGLPEMNEPVCVYEEGVLTGILESFSHKNFEVREIDCWRSGDNTCRFIARMLP